MDRQTLHDIGGSSGKGDDGAVSSSRFPHSTPNSRRQPTGRRPSRRHESQRYDRNVEDDDDIPASDLNDVPWDEQQRDVRKSNEATTPTLIDEVDFDEEEEKEIAALERMKLAQNSAILFGKDESHLRRTPGAQMYKSRYNQQSIRRTPGASSMQHASGTGDGSGLGFGLTLSTPVAASRDENLTRPPRAPGSSTRDQRGAFVSPWTLSKDSNSEARVYSPNTLRLTEDLGNLLLEEDDPVEDSSQPVTQLVFGNASTLKSTTEATNQRKEECWTTPYVVSMDAPSRVSRNTRGRRGKGDGFRRSRGKDRYGPSRNSGNQVLSNTGGFLPYAKQPEPVRNAQPPAIQDFGNRGLDNEAFGDSQRPLNFSGAFEPPSKVYDGSFYRPIPSTAPPNLNLGHHPSEMNMEPGYHGASPVFGAPFHQSFGSHPAIPPPFSSPSPIFDGPPPMNQSQPYHEGYPIHGGMMHPAPHNFMPVHHHHEQQQRMPVPQFVTPQVWPQPPMAMQFDAPPMEQTNWQGAPHGAMGGWPMNPFQFSGPPSSNDHSFNMAPPNQDPSAEMESNIQVQGQPQGVRPEISKKKNSRKTTSQKGKKIQPKNEKAPKFEPSNKKKQTKGSSQDQTLLTNSNDQASAKELADLKRAELNETPAMRTAFKNFYKKFRAAERTSYEYAKEFAMETLEDDSFPEVIRWKVYLELADLAKRTNKFHEARKLYQQVCLLQPYANQGWLEYSKLEEECGNMNMCAKILRAGLECCELNENLLTRSIKHEEKMGNVGRARELLARLKHTGIEKVWRTVLEGALLEARAGNDLVARRVLKYLMHHVPWYGPLYLEAYKLEKDLGRTKEALAVVERGLTAIPRYGPLWFGAFQLCEQIDCTNKRFDLPKSMEMIQRATDNISKELIWKVHLEAATMLERVSLEYLDSTTEPTSIQNMELCRRRFALTILSCPPNLRWKVWLASGRMEVLAGNYDAARRLFRRAQVVVPDKGRAAALLECARLEEYVGDTELARAILSKSRNVSGNDWKVWLESVLVETRNKNYARAIELAELGLEQHSGTGRLWASLVQLRHFEEGEEAQFETLKRALNAVPKSGEVWCEGARIHLNPFAHTFDHRLARRHLLFATKFTPQYGDGFLESLKLEMIEQWLFPIAIRIWESSHDNLIQNPDGDDQEGLIDFVFKISRDLFSICNSKFKGRSKEEDSGVSCSCLDKQTVKFICESLNTSSSNSIDLSQVRLSCANADPNYGSFWFLCSIGPTDTARKVLSQAIKLVFDDMRAHAHFYLAAFMRRFAILTTMKQNNNKNVDDSDGNTRSADRAVQIENDQNKALLTAPSLEQIFQLGSSKYSNDKGMDLLESTMTSSDFTSGLVALNRQHPIERMSLRERRKALYGTSVCIFS